MQKRNKKRNPIARQLKHWRNKIVKSKKMIDTETMSKYLGWGKQIGFRRYRNYLRTVDGIYTTMINKKEYYIWNDEI